MHENLEIKTAAFRLTFKSLGNTISLTEVAV